MPPATLAHQIRFVTRNYERLQGLRLVPFGVTASAVGLALALWPSPPSFGLFVALVLPAALLSEAGRRWAGRYYTRAFGTVEGTSPLPPAELFLFDRGTSMSSRILPGLAVGAAVAVLTIFHVPSYIILSSALVLWSVALTLYLQRAGQLATRSYWIAGAVIIALLGVVLALPFASLASLHTDAQIFRFLGMVLAPYGLLMLLCSWLDHRLLAHSFAVAAGTQHATTI